MQEKKLNTTFSINGGIGRVISSIPAIEKYQRLNPDDDFKIIIYGWDQVMWSHPTLQSRTFNALQKGTFDLIIKNSKLVVPEPYNLHSYYNQEKSLAEAFDEEINHTNDHSDIGKPNLYLSSAERGYVKNLIDKIKKDTNKKKVIVFQPYGSGMRVQPPKPHDPSNRSLDVDDYLTVVRELSKHAAVIFYGGRDVMHPKDSFSIPVFDHNPDIRMFMALIAEADYFLGVDSCGQHMAYAFNKPGTVIMGSTFEKNISYPDHFKFFRNGVTPVYNPIRIGGIDNDFADRMNDGIMTFTKDQLMDLCRNVISDLNKK